MEINSRVVDLISHLFLGKDIISSASYQWFDVFRVNFQSDVIIIQGRAWSTPNYHLGSLQ